MRCRTVLNHIAYSCKGRGVCPAGNTRRMAETAAHLVDQVFPQVVLGHDFFHRSGLHLGKRGAR
jgi:hypothetical protein